MRTMRARIRRRRTDRPAGSTSSISPVCDGCSSGSVGTASGCQSARHDLRGSESGTNTASATAAMGARVTGSRERRACHLVELA